MNGESGATCAEMQVALIVCGGPGDLITRKNGCAQILKNACFSAKPIRLFLCPLIIW